MPNVQLCLIFLLQIAIIVAACRLVGWCARKFLGQPQVVGEMIAGVILGPSFFGALFPIEQALLFPAETKPILFAISQFGVGLYMFLVGLGFDREEFGNNARSAAFVSIGGIIAPFAAAALLVPWMLGIGGLFVPGLSQEQATLFLGAAIAITAFPMLARIIHERGFSGTPLGTLSLSAGAIGDAGAWCVVALVLAGLGNSPMIAVKTIGGGLAFAILMIGFAPKWLAPLNQLMRGQNASKCGIAIALILFAISAYTMDVIGIHAVFGGFLLGTAMPRGSFGKSLRRRLEPLTVVILLPLFFTFSGLNTQLLVVNNASLIAVAIAIISSSILAKGGACYLAARLSGQDHPTAMGIGALMNARGLMELIIINIGLQRGIIGPALFAILVTMAIVTTLMASPLFELVYGRAARMRQPIMATTNIP